MVPRFAYQHRPQHSLLHTTCGDCITLATPVRPAVLAASARLAMPAAGFGLLASPGLAVRIGMEADQIGSEVGSWSAVIVAGLACSASSGFGVRTAGSPAERIGLEALLCPAVVAAAELYSGLASAVGLRSGSPRLPMRTTPGLAVPMAD